MLLNRKYISKDLSPNFFKPHHRQTTEGYCRGLRTLFPESRKEGPVWTRAREGKASEKFKPKGPQARGACPAERMPVLARSSVPVLPAVNADTLRAVFAPVMGKHALPITDGRTGYPPQLPWGQPRGAQYNQLVRERARDELHIQIVISRHACREAFIGGRRGVITKYLAKSSA